MKGKLIAVLALTLSGCTGARTEYYQAVAEANKAEAQAYAAKASALAAVAAADPDSADAVAMALALSGVKTVSPVYIEDSAVTWAKVLASPVATLGGAAIAADVAKAGIKANERVQIQASQASSQTLVGIAETISAGNTASNQAIVDVAMQPSGVPTDFATAALGTVESVAIGSQESLVTVSAQGLDATTVVAQDGMNLIHDTAVDSNATILELSKTLQPIVPVVEITPVIYPPAP